MGIPLFWAIHHSTQPASEASVSIALVNALGNLGGFIGPTLVGSLHDSAALSAAVCGGGGATRGASASCFAQWGLGTVSLGTLFLMTSAFRAWVSKR